MRKKFIENAKLSEWGVWQKNQRKRVPVHFLWELTARCNNDCRHCYINLPAGDKEAIKKELTLTEAKHLIDEAVSMGVFACSITGGEPLLRKDFSDIYLYLKKRGILFNLFTSATLITKKHIDLFKKYPPVEIEVTVYGVTKKTYERVTGKEGSFDKFINGLNLLTENGIKPRLKAMALKSNAKELSQISDFCEKYTKDYYRFDPFLSLRYDRDSIRNDMIKAERLSPEKIVEIEQEDSNRSKRLIEGCDHLISERTNTDNKRILQCVTGFYDFTISYDGYFLICSFLRDPDCMYNLREGSLKDAWENFAPKIINKESKDKEFLSKCPVCPVLNLCMWCGAFAYLETGKMDEAVDYYCKIAHARAEWLKKRSKNK